MSLHFPEMSIPLKSRNHFNFSTPKKYRFLLKPIIFEYLCKQSESCNMAYSRSTIQLKSKMAACFNLNNNGISKEL